jgi:hypothetical protein
MADWYYAKEGRQYGPISAAELKRLAQSGELQPDDLVFGEGAKDWKPASSVRGLFPSGGGRVSPQAPTRGAAAETGQSFNFEAAAPPPDEEDEGTTRRPPRAAKGGGGFFMDVLMFRRMVAPTIILILFYLSVISIILGGLIGAVMMVVNPPGGSTGLGLLAAVGILILIPIYILIYRLMSEVMIVVFRIYETLTEIKKQQEKPGDKQ